ncbi:hypothetical protein SIN8267_01048 [Sinobacterium norvegicum]|uniref:DNA-binding protein VF530 n=1 Tax=Sinobacterium norvegicum TaxID=1641715 RepID=A0ABM9AE16_9GAMM|nr:VF530 family DNA-binding protein [Sinobacterium norvegicum]CAH0990947.1 hypothetical protein SIN8267_01048 [Sinobacterium norvegicum]
MTDIALQQNNPLHGVKLDDLLADLVEYYGWDVLADAVNINCFKSNPSIDSSLKFLRKTVWAREKLESFYLYRFKNLPLAPESDLEIPPRDRIIPFEQQPGEPAVVIPRQRKPKVEPVDDNPWQGSDQAEPGVDTWAQFRKK